MVLGCLGTALAELLGGEVDFHEVNGCGMSLEVELILVLMNEKVFFGRGGGRSTERTYGFK